MIFGQIKAYLFAAGGAIIAVLLLAIKVLSGRNSKLRKKAEEAEARVHRAKVIQDRDNELEAQTRSHRVDVKKEVDEKGASDELSDPNDW